MNYKYLNVTIDNRVGWIEYNRPPINAFNWEMLRKVPAALEEIGECQHPNHFGYLNRIIVQEGESICMDLPFLFAKNRFFRHSDLTSRPKFR